MKASESYAQGIKKATAEGKLVWLLWLVNVLFASFIYFAFSGFLGRVLSLSAAAQTFLKTFDMNTFFEVISHYGEELNAVISSAIFILIGYTFASVFLNGGILYTLSHPIIPDEKRRLAPLFFEGAGKFFGRFFRLLIFSLTLWLGVIVITLMLHMILNPITEGGTNEVLLFYLVLVRIAFALFLAFLVKMILDYARIIIVIEDSRNVFRSLLRAAGFVFWKLGATLAIYYLFMLTAAAIILVYWLAQKVVRTNSLLPILIAFIIGQIFILSRGWIRVGLQAAQMAFIQSSWPTRNTIEPESIAPEENSPGQTT
jgi:hypothetical protein